MSEIDKKTRADLFRKRIEDKNTLTGAGAIYVGTGKKIEIPNTQMTVGNAEVTGAYYETVGVAPTAVGQVPVSVSGTGTAGVAGLEFKSVNDAMKGENGSILLAANGMTVRSSNGITFLNEDAANTDISITNKTRDISVNAAQNVSIEGKTKTKISNISLDTNLKGPLTGNLYTAPSGTPSLSTTGVTDTYSSDTSEKNLVPILYNVGQRLSSAEERLNSLGFKKTSILTRGVDVVVKGDSTAVADFRQGFVIKPSAGELSYTVKLTDLYDTPLIGKTLTRASFNPELDVFTYNKDTNYSFTQCFFYDLHQNGSLWELGNRFTDGVEISKVQPSSDFTSLTFNFTKIPSDAFYITFPVEHKENSSIERYFIYNRKYYLADITKYGNVWTLDFYNTARTYLDSTNKPDATEEHPYEVVLNNWPPMKTFDGKIITGIYKTLGCGNNGILYDCGVHYKYQNGETPKLLFIGTGTVFTRIRGTNALITS